jgi:SAM-dependent methyltransferase
MEKSAVSNDLSTTELNHQFYDHLYGSNNNRLIFLIHAMISFDQQSKTKGNLAVSRRLTATSRSARKRILDYGSGWGTFLLRWPSARADVFCFDISRSAMRLLAEAGRMVGRPVGGLIVDEDGRLVQGDFDLILCSHVLEHVPSDEDIFQKLVEALKPGGHIVINVPINEMWKDPKHVRKYTLESLSHLFQICSLEIMHSEERDRWTAFFIDHQHQKQNGRVAAFSYKALRVILAIAPLGVVSLMERFFLRSYEPQQLIMAGRKPQAVERPRNEAWA